MRLRLQMISLIEVSLNGGRMGRVVIYQIYNNAYNEHVIPLVLKNLYNIVSIPSRVSMHVAVVVG